MQREYTRKMTPTQRKAERIAKDRKKQMLKDLWSPLILQYLKPELSMDFLSYMNQINVPFPHVLFT